MFPYRPEFGFNVVPEDEVQGFRVGADGNPDPNFQPVKDPLRCSGPNSDRL